MSSEPRGREFRAPATIHVGRGALRRLPEALRDLGAQRIVIVTDRVMAASRWMDVLQALADEAGATSTIFGDLGGEPTTRDVEAAGEVVRRADADALIGFGGGSSMDTAKSAAALARNPGQLPDYEGYERIPVRGLPVVTIPTTAGSGSEVTRGIAVTDAARDVKMLIMSARVVPAVAIIDPEPTHSMPPAVTASTGLDALTHAIESYVSHRHHPTTDALALDALRRIPAALVRAYRHPDDAAAREQMSIAALHAGLAFTNASVALVHGMSRPIGAHFHVPHGLSNAMLLPDIMEFTRPGDVPRFAEIGRALGAAGTDLDDAAASEAGVAAVQTLCQDLEVSTLRGWGVDPDAFRAATPQMAADALASGSPSNNPREAGAAEIEMLYAQVIAR